eukprot:m.293652 g.293652  ORF g.293652 m.293652 type:complete len:54 (-) comp235367_c0_seq1:43-204(-)
MGACYLLLGLDLTLVSNSVDCVGSVLESPMNESRPESFLKERTVVTSPFIQIE